MQETHPRIQIGSIYADDRQRTHVMRHGEREHGEGETGEVAIYFSTLLPLIRIGDTITCVKWLYLVAFYCCHSDRWESALMC